MNPNSFKKKISLVLAPLRFQMLKSLSYRFDAAAYFSIITFELKLKKKYLFLSFFFFFLSHLQKYFTSNEFQHIQAKHSVSQILAAVFC